MTSEEKPLQHNHKHRKPAPALISSRDPESGESASLVAPAVPEKTRRSGSSASRSGSLSSVPDSPSKSSERSASSARVSSSAEADLARKSADADQTTTSEPSNGTESSDHYLKSASPSSQETDSDSELGQESPSSTDPEVSSDSPAADSNSAPTASQDKSASKEKRPLHLSLVSSETPAIPATDDAPPKKTRPKRKSRLTQVKEAYSNNRRVVHRTCFIASNLLVLLVFAISSLFILLWPEHLSLVGLTPEQGHVIIMYEIALLLLLAGMQSSFTREFRVASMVGSVIVFCEATIVVFCGH